MPIQEKEVEKTTPAKRWNKKWTDEEVEILERKVNNNEGGPLTINWEQIADRLNRTVPGCKSKYRREFGNIMGKIEICDKIKFQYCSGYRQTCSYCKSPMRGDYGLCVTKSTTHSNYNVWIHPSCLKELVGDIEEAFEEYEERLREKITENLAKSLEK